VRSSPPDWHHELWGSGILARWAGLLLKHAAPPFCAASWPWYVGRACRRELAWLCAGVSDVLITCSRSSAGVGV
jgi:hypothetical protein